MIEKEKKLTNQHTNKFLLLSPCFARFIDGEKKRHFIQLKLISSTSIRVRFTHMANNYCLICTEH